MIRLCWCPATTPILGTSMSESFSSSYFLVTYLTLSSHFGKPGHLQLPMSDQWREHPGPLDPTSSPSSPYSPASSLVPSPMMPRGSPTVTRHLKKCEHSSCWRSSRIWFINILPISWRPRSWQWASNFQWHFPKPYWFTLAPAAWGW